MELRIQELCGLENFDGAARCDATLKRVKGNMDSAMESFVASSSCSPKEARAHLLEAALDLPITRTPPVDASRR